MASEIGSDNGIGRMGDVRAAGAGHPAVGSSSGGTVLKLLANWVVVGVVVPLLLVVCVEALGMGLPEHAIAKVCVSITALVVLARRGC